MPNATIKSDGVYALVPKFDSDRSKNDMCVYVLTYKNNKQISRRLMHLTLDEYVRLVNRRDSASSIKDLVKGVEIRADKEYYDSLCGAVERKEKEDGKKGYIHVPRFGAEPLRLYKSRAAEIADHPLLKNDYHGGYGDLIDKLFPINPMRRDKK